RADGPAPGPGAQARAGAWIRRAPPVDVRPVERNGGGRPAAGAAWNAPAPVEAVSTGAPAVLSRDRGAGVPPPRPSGSDDRRGPSGKPVVPAAADPHPRGRPRPPARRA